MIFFSLVFELYNNNGRQTTKSIDDSAGYHNLYDIVQHKVYKDLAPCNP